MKRMEIRCITGYTRPAKQMVFSVSSLTRGMHHFHENCERYAGDESCHGVLSFFTSHRAPRARRCCGFRLALMSSKNKNRKGKREEKKKKGKEKRKKGGKEMKIREREKEKKGKETYPRAVRVTNRVEPSPPFGGIYSRGIHGCWVYHRTAKIYDR